MPDADAPPKLDDLLAVCARQSGLREHAMTPSHDTLRAALVAYPALADEARQRLATIDASVLLRDHISRWLKATLEATLAG
jgi:hypothetical protein